MEANRRPLLLEHSGALVRLASPSVGWFGSARRSGALLVPGDVAGTLCTLGRSCELIVPPGASGRVVNAADPRRRRPVGYGTLLYELQALEHAALDAPGADPTAPASAALEHTLRAPQAGRFWLAPAPGAAPFVRQGDTLKPGQAVGWIEVMKTFSHVVWRPDPKEHAFDKVRSVLVEDGGDVDEGDPLFALERS